jgi:hypothetical protein
MKRYYAQAIALCLGGGLILAAANLLLPFIFAAMLAFGLGVVAFSRVFMVPGPLTIRRDLLMFAVIVGALVIARFTAVGACEVRLAATARCTERYLRASGLVNGLSVAAPIMFFWSWVRLRLLRDQIADWRRQ